jgi:hypothetical protein
MRRLTGKRLVKGADGKYIKNYHEQLFNNQRRFFVEHTDIFKNVARSYEDYFHEYKGSEEEAREHYNDPHQKRLLRLKAWKELNDANQQSDDTDPWVKSVLWKLKKDEWAKPGKKPRMIGDLGVGASLRGFRVTNSLKVAQESEPVYVNGGEMYFCKSPDPVIMEQVFKKLIDPPGRFYFVYFSDDSCLSIRRKDGGVDFYNLDISSCDASHGPAIFQQLVDLVPPTVRPDMQMLVDQCQLPLRVVSRVDPSVKLLLKPNRPMLYSGSTITTGINNIANLAIGIAISECDYTSPDDIRLAAERAGYIVSGCKPLQHPEDLQFLKHSPVLDSNNCYKPMLNLGVLLRASGVCRGDLPGRGPFSIRARDFQAALLNGAYPQADFEVLQLMKGVVKGSKKIEIPHLFEYKVEVNDNFQPFFAQRDSIMRRYRLSDLEYAEVIEFAKSGFEQFSNSVGLSKILDLDYGLECCEDDGVVKYNGRD